MTLRGRLLVFGAALPLLLLLLAFIGVGVLLDQQLVRRIDQALLTQAAVEAVSLFDASDGGPHLHLGRSPLHERVRTIEPAGALYDAAGRRLLVHPEGAETPPSLSITSATRDPEVSTREIAGERVREIRVRVDAPDGRAFVLWLGGSLADHDRTLTTYWAAAALFLALAALILLTVQTRHARSIDRRVQALAGHLARIRLGDLDAVPPPDAAGDVLAELRDAVAETTAKLRSARAAQDRFVAEAAHELRTPLAAMRTGIEVTLRRERDRDELREALASARDEVERLSELATRLLDLAAPSSDDAARRTTDLRALLERAVDAARVVAETKRVAVELDTPAESSAFVDEVQIRQAVDNLLTNALRHTPPSSAIHVRLAREASSWTIRVRDEGEGVAEAEREQIFEPFHRGQAEGRGASELGGAGLGLAIVRAVARRHGGDVRIDPATHGKGAEFIVELPDR